jgi:cytochrome oxidase Cu insertion factor (SCO1/SenC/PrrC family)
MMIRRMFLSLIVVLALVAVAPVDAPARAVQTRDKKTVKKVARYSCPMHPEVVSTKPGKCPKCGMTLRLVKDEDETHEPTAPPAPPNTDPSARLNIPETRVLDQNGKRLNFYNDLVKGKTVAINFIFTTCTTICPPMTATFRRVQQQLGARVGRDVRLISVSVDPVTDTPERLAAFAAKFKADTGWTFVTGDKPEIDKLLAALGASVGDKTDHSPTIIIINDTTGKTTRTYGLAPPSQLARIITDSADGK